MITRAGTEQEFAVNRLHAGGLGIPKGIKPGDIGLVGTQTRASALDRFFERSIQWATDSPVNHAFIYVGGGRIVEAISRVSLSSAAKYSAVRWSTGRIPAIDTATDAQRGQVVSYAMSRVGERYNLLGLLAVGMYQRRAGHLIDGDEWWVRLLNADGMDFCSELVAKCWLAAGIDLCKSLLPVVTSPGDLYNRAT